MMTNELIILGRSHDLLVWLIPKSEKFPRIYRHTVVSRMMDSVLDLHESLLQANKQRDVNRVKVLRQCDLHLDRLRLYLRLAHQLTWLSNGQYQHVSKMVAEIGRLLGGWLKQSLS